MESLRAAVSAEQAEKKLRARYSPDLRARIAAFALGRRADGVSWKHIGRELGMCPTTIERYAVDGAHKPETGTGTAPVASPVVVPVSVAHPAVEADLARLIIISPKEPTLANCISGLPFQLSRCMASTLTLGSLQRWASPRRQE